MNQKTYFEENLYNEFKDTRDAVFSSEATNKEKETAKKYIPLDIIQSVDNLKNIIKENVKLYLSVGNVTPKEYDSIRTLISEVKTVDISNFTRLVTKLFDITKLLVEYYDSETNELKDFNTIDIKHKAVETNYYNNHIKILATHKKENEKNRYSNEYLFKTFSPFYTCFMLKNSEQLKNNSSIIFNNMIFEANAEINMIDISGLSAKDKISQKIITPYLIERGSGLNFKFFLFQYVKDFIKELEKQKTSSDSKESLTREYLKFFTTFRDLYMFYNEDFFKEIHIIVSQLLIARQNYLNDVKSLVNCKIFDLVCKNKIYEIIEELYNYMIKLLSDTSDEILNIEVPQIAFNHEFEEPKSRVKPDQRLWALVQDYINLHIQTDYNSTYFDIIPQFNVYKYESSIVWHELATMKKHSFI